MKFLNVCVMAAVCIAAVVPDAAEDVEVELELFHGPDKVRVKESHVSSTGLFPVRDEMLACFEKQLKSPAWINGICQPLSNVTWTSTARRWKSPKICIDYCKEKIEVAILKGWDGARCRARKGGEKKKHATCWWQYCNTAAPEAVSSGSNGPEY
ncbi:hypothetical protein TruAng_001483 [Truncatella angustata]|nr:hypothetical protein TruAng_001483 [Truncatella angustata]